MQSTRVELEQKLRDERRAAAAAARSQETAVAEEARIKANDAVAAAQREAAAAAEIVLYRDREQSATQENANITAEISDVMTRVHLMKTQLRGLSRLRMAARCRKSASLWSLSRCTRSLKIFWKVSSRPHPMLHLPQQQQQQRHLHRLLSWRWLACRRT